MRRARLLVTLSLLALGGCSAFRATVGVGLGLGASAKVGPVDICGLGGVGETYGNYWGSVGTTTVGDMGLPGLVRGEVADPDEGPTRVGFSGPLAFAVYPFLSETNRAGYRPMLLGRPFEVSAGVYLLFFSFNVGFDPAGLVHDARFYFSQAAGWDGPEPPAPKKRLSPLPEDDLDDVPYKLVTAEDLALVESGTATERARRCRKLDAALREPLALVQVVSEEQEGAVERWVEPRLGMALAPLGAEARERLAAIREHEVESSFARAERAREPEVIAQALAAAPFAPRSAQAGLERRRGELLLERGELAEAAASFDDEAAHRDAGDGASAKRRVAVARGLLDATGPAPPAGNAWSGSADLGGIRVGAQGRSVWALTLAGDVAWERSDTLPEGWSESKVIGAASGLALMEAQAKGRAWVVAVDDDGGVRWKTPLPTAAACASPMDQCYALGHGRLYVGRVDRVLALDPATGRVLWMTVRRDVDFDADDAPRSSQHVSLHWRPTPGPPRRRPDGETTGFRLRLGADVLEVSSGRGRDVVRLDARTGCPK